MLLFEHKQHLQSYDTQFNAKGDIFLYRNQFLTTTTGVNFNSKF